MIPLLLSAVKSPKVLMIGGAVICAVVIGFLLFQWGRSYERSNNLQATLETIKERDKINGEVNSLSDADLCARLGGRWVSETCE